MYKNINFTNDSELREAIQAYANKYHNGNFTEALKDLARRQLNYMEEVE